MFHSNMHSVAQRIRKNYALLPVGERKLADLILEMRGECAAYSATELASRAGVSKATGARLVRRLGFADFQELREQARKGLQSGSPLAELADSTVEGTLAGHLGHDIASLTRAAETISSDDAIAAVDILARARSITVVGFRNSYPLAFYARELLAQVRSNVNLLPVSGQTVSEGMADLGRNDAILALGFRRRPPALAHILRVAAAANSRTILLSDPTLGDIGKFAEIVLRCTSRGARMFDSYAVAMSLVNFLASGVGAALGASAQERLRRIESLHERFRDLEP